MRRLVSFDCFDWCQMIGQIAYMGSYPKTAIHSVFVRDWLKPQARRVMNKMNKSDQSEHTCHRQYQYGQNQKPQVLIVSKTGNNVNKYSAAYAIFWMLRPNTVPVGMIDEVDVISTFCISLSFKSQYFSKANFVYIPFQYLKICTVYFMHFHTPA